jgi:hypothetical protein
MALLYTGAGLKYRALGDVVILVAFGPAIMVFVSCALLDSRSHMLGIPLREIGWYSLAFSALTVAVLHANNARDAKQDAKSGVLLASSDLESGLGVRAANAPHLRAYNRCCHCGDASRPRAIVLLFHTAAGRRVQHYPLGIARLQQLGRGRNALRPVGSSPRAQVPKPGAG